MTAEHGPVTLRTLTVLGDTLGINKRLQTYGENGDKQLKPPHETGAWLL